MENKEKMDKTDKYMLVLMGLLYLYMYGKNVIGCNACYWLGLDILYHICCDCFGLLPIGLVGVFYYSDGDNQIFRST